MTAQAPWLDRMVALKGTQEIKGRRNNPQIVAMFHAIGHTEITDDETSWCATAAGFCLKESGFPTTPVAVNMLARSYLNYGIECEPKAGALAIWPRGNSSWQGHINVVQETRRYRGRTLQVKCIGGNQGGMKGGDAVTESGWRDASEALGFRWPVAPTVKALRDAGSSEIKQADTLEGGAVVAVGGSIATAVVEHVTAAPAPLPPVVMGPVPPLLPEGTTETIQGTSQLMEAINALTKVVTANYWVCVVALGALGLFWVARLWKSGRLNRHLLGLPISSQAATGSVENASDA